MKNNILEYKGYHTKVEFDAKNLVLTGKIEGINDLVNFECDNMKDVEKEFHEAVDDYLEFCKEVGKEPDREYKGTFNVRINPELHKRLAVVAMKNDTTLNASVEKAIQEYVSEEHKAEKNSQNTVIILAEGLKTESTYQYVKKMGHVPSYSNVIMKYSEEMIS